MKVGTDGVLLGAWARVGHCQRILDMGTGTGVIPFNLCEFGADIKAIDISENQILAANEIAEGKVGPC